ncbi:MAG: DEAD/DEAH box helicase [Rhodospirillaceae bacterium]|nr:DEAD/DEAH box helicase [Rhodospirillaceae bacterium]
MTEFEGVHPALAQALDKRGYTNMTPVQHAVLAPELKDADTLVSAQTGSGKTVAFGMSIAPTLLDDSPRFSHVKAPLALVVAPTRELAMQVKTELEWLYEMTKASIASCVGGMNMRDERRALDRGAHIVVGTPGRLRDHIERGSFDTSGLKAVVLDEADEMLDLGFREDLEYILDAAPRERRTLMFSATVPRSIATLAKRYQRDAVRVATTSEKSQHGDIEYRALSVAPNDRENAIVNVLRYFEAKNALVFCATRATVNHLTSRLSNRGFSVVALSGELGQTQRTHALQAMRDGRARVCIATDVAARGIDLPNLELVIHADIPRNRETLLHRSGRTGRAGRKGVCTLIVPHNWRKRTERLLDSASIEAVWAKPPSAEDVMRRDHERLLMDPTLNEPLTEIEQTFAEEILSRYSADQVAAAFVRKHFADQAAPEELLDNAPIGRGERQGERQGKQHDDFKDGVWFSLSVGREHKAEPRWLLPMLCRAGHFTKRDVGAIRIRQSETFVELAPGCVDKFLEALGPSCKMEKTISVTRLQEAPNLSNETRKPNSEKSSSEKPRSKKSYSDKSGPDKSNPDRSSSDRPNHKKSPTGKPARGKLSLGKPGPHRKAKQEREFPAKHKSAEQETEPNHKSVKKPKHKKGYKSQFAKTGAKTDGPRQPGSSPLKRKKPKGT